jgi:hypothetical protein
MGRKWSVKIDGWEMNDGVNYYVDVPEASNLFERQVVMAQIDGDYPVMVRVQPQAARMTLLVAMGQGTTDALFDARIAELQTKLGGGLHTLTLQLRGMPVPKSVQVVAESILPSFTQRLATVQLLAPRPVLE